MVRTTRWGQMLASTTFTIAVAGMLSGVLFLIEGKSLLYDKVRLLWIEVCAISMTCNPSLTLMHIIGV